jgi:hypothetical protein
MLNTNQARAKIDIAKEYVALHKEFDIPVGLADDAYHRIYNNLYGALYGAVELLDDETGEYEVEISLHDTATGKPILFNFIDPDYTENLWPFITEMKSEGFTHNQIIDALEDGAVLAAYELSQDEAEEMHNYLHSISSNVIVQ